MYRTVLELSAPWFVAVGMRVRFRPVTRPVFALGTILVLVPASVSSGCREGGDCTEIGCQSGVSVTFTPPDNRDMRAPVKVTTCLGSECQDTLHGQVGTSLVGEVSVESSAADLTAPQRLTLRAVDAGGRVLVENSRRIQLSRIQPNGPGCDPVCWHADVNFD